MSAGSFIPRFQVKRKTKELAEHIVKRKLVDEELHVASLNARNVIEASLDPLVTISQDGKITDVNKATEQATGVTRERLIGSDFSDYFTEPEKAREGYEQVLSKGLVINYPLTLRHASGRTIDVLYNATVYRNEAGEVQGVFAAARDITERKRLEEALLRSNADLAQFAYVASHDLQEPLRMVSSYMQLIEQRYKDKLDTAGIEFINFAVDGARRMQTMINDLLTFSRVGTRGKAFEPTDCEVILDQTLADLKMAIKDSGAIITRDPLPTVMADGAQMAQLFQNLIGNAIKFREREPLRVHISAQAKEKDWLFSVRDNGIGIDPQYFERIFVIFQRLHSKEEYPGTGIGLALCNRVVERHGGRIWVESQPGKGSIFYFTISQGEVNRV
jgi:PAS domain S-box-containing protein